MTIEFEITPVEQNELAELAQRRTQRRFVPSWLSVIHWYVLWPVTILGLGFWYESVQPVIVSFIAFSVIGYGSNYLWRRLYERGMERELPNMPTLWTVSVDDMGLTLSSRKSRHWYAWSDFHKVEKTKNYVFVHAEGGEFIYAPRRAFLSEDDCGRFIGLVENHLARLKPAPLA